MIVELREERACLDEALGLERLIGSKADTQKRPPAKVAETDGHRGTEEIERLYEWQPPCSICFIRELILSSSPQMPKGDSV